MGVEGYAFETQLLMVRQGPGLAGVPGSEGEYMWAGYGGTFFWIDPKEELAVVYMAQTPGAIRPYYRRMIKDLGWPRRWRTDDSQSHRRPSPSACGP